MGDNGMMLGMLFGPQQSFTVVVAGKALNPAGHCVHSSVPVAFENVSAAQDKQDVVAMES
jgi:hypothetical protein